MYSVIPPHSPFISWLRVLVGITLIVLSDAAQIIIWRIITTKKNIFICVQVRRSLAAKVSLFDHGVLSLFFRRMGRSLFYFLFCLACILVSSTFWVYTTFLATTELDTEMLLCSLQRPPLTSQSSFYFSGLGYSCMLLQALLWLEFLLFGVSVFYCAFLTALLGIGLQNLLFLVKFFHWLPSLSGPSS